jgi:hypothetical protein
MFSQQMTPGASTFSKGQSEHRSNMAVFSYQKTALLFQIIWLQGKNALQEAG